MKKCKGCGIILQDKDKEKEGYCLSLDQDYCQRCFRLSHYGDTSFLKQAQPNNNDILDTYNKQKDAIFVLIVDCFDAFYLDQDKLLEYFIDKKVILVINKTDLLPRNVNDDKLDDIYLKIINKIKWPNLFDVLLTYRHDPYFNDLFFSILAKQNNKNIVFAGRANAGKSTLINRLIGNNDLTVSPYPGTTIANNEINYQGYCFIDTPGLLDEGSILSYIEEDKIKALLPIKTLKTKVFQLYSPQSYFVEGLIRLDIIPENRASINFLISDEVDIHRCKKDKAKDYYDNNQNNISLKLEPWKKKEERIKYNKAYYIKGLGMFRINGKADIRLYCYDKIDVYYSEVRI